MQGWSRVKGITLDVCQFSILCTISCSFASECRAAVPLYCFQTDNLHSPQRSWSCFEVLFGFQLQQNTPAQRQFHFYRFHLPASLVCLKGAQNLAQHKRKQVISSNALSLHPFLELWPAWMGWSTDLPNPLTLAADYPAPASADTLSFSGSSCFVSVPEKLLCCLAADGINLTFSVIKSNPWYLKIQLFCLCVSLVCN